MRTYSPNASNSLVLHSFSFVCFVMIFDFRQKHMYKTIWIVTITDDPQTGNISSLLIYIE